MISIMSSELEDLNAQLFLAYRSRDVKKVQILIQKGANVNTQTDHGQFLLCEAVRKKEKLPLVFTFLASHQYQSNGFTRIIQNEVSDERKVSSNQNAEPNRNHDIADFIQRDSKTTSICHISRSGSSRSPFKYSPYSLLTLAALQIKSSLEGVKFTDNLSVPIEENIRSSEIRFRKEAKEEVKKSLCLHDQDCINNEVFLVSKRVISCKDHHWFANQLKIQRRKNNPSSSNILQEQSPHVGIKSGTGLSMISAVEEIRHLHKVSSDYVYVDSCWCNVPDVTGYTPLYNAVLFTRIENIVYLLIAGARGDVLTVSGVSPLHMAVTNNNLLMVQLLLKFGTNPNHLNIEKSSALHLACSSSQVRIVLELLSHGANINSVNRDGYTPLSKALCFSRTDIVTLLINFGADVNLGHSEKAEYGRPLHEAVKLRHIDMVKLLLENGAKSSPAFYNLHKAVQLECVPIIEMLLENLDHDINMKDENQFTPLLYACSFMIDTTIVKLLLDKGANPNIHGPEDETPLHFAIFRYSPNTRKAFHEIFHAMLEKGLSLDCTSSLGTLRSFNYALFCQHMVAAELFMLHGVGCNISNEEYRKIVNSAILQAKPHIVKLLVMTADVGYIPRDNSNVVPDSMKSLVDSLSSSPRTLKEICRVAIRRQLRFKVVQNVPSLPLPSSLQNYLLMRDFDLLSLALEREIEN